MVATNRFRTSAVGLYSSAAARISTARMSVVVSGADTGNAVCSTATVMLAAKGVDDGFDSSGSEAAQQLSAAAWLTESRPS